MGEDVDSKRCGNTQSDAPPPEDPAASREPLDLLIEQKKKLEQLNSWFDIALNNMVRGLSMFDAEQRLIVCNKSYRQMYALPEELTRPGTPLSEIVRYHVWRETGRDSAEDVAKQAIWLDQHAAKLASGRSFSHIQSLRDGRKILVTYQPLPDGGWVDIQEDITEKRRAEEKIEWLARHDTLTGIANRFYFRETFEDALRRLCNGVPLALHWIDLDRFKEVNDTFGHPIGDALLRAVAERLRASVRQADFLARLGGDEFAIIQADTCELVQCEHLAKRVLQDISKPYQILGHAISISASIGIVRAPEDGVAADELLKNADIALYSVKSTGRRNFALFGGSTAQTPGAQHRFESEIRTALAQNEFELHYQPILNLQSQHAVSCEALLRWRHPRVGLIPAADFLAAAERTGAILEIGRWVLAQACRDAKGWGGVKVAVNLSQLQCESDDLSACVRRALDGAKLEPRLLRLEVGETLLAQSEAAVRETLQEIRKLGVGIALDDFGKAGGSLRNLKAIPFDEIKIDRALVKDLPLSAESAAIVKAVVALAQSLGIRSVAEGVETIDELSMVVRTGCNKVQGYYISRPVPAGELGAVLSECPQRLALAA